MIKNYANSLPEKSIDFKHEKPSPTTISFLLDYSKSFQIEKGTILKEIRCDKN
ncbi:hypothetical protein [Wenyingzhuangia sp. 2_MG-2023]|uniref:hypothetical protein n=1 Tax=Wenyingzhuangia sp. 2_MG-2023 TaxID=3062639 RepID=UPI0026E31E26|nr:hypothetical protein [Wenyingzhuangia sp. 2_MG-2023]MDO6738590.1 hypothetical protein [Wenyingzhuangia sp. 2_MG-2023]